MCVGSCRFGFLVLAKVKLFLLLWPYQVGLWEKQNGFDVGWSG